MHTYCLAAAALVGLAGSASAVTYEGDVSLSFGFGKYDGGEYRSATLGVQTDLDFGNGFGLDLSGALTRYDDDGDNFSTSVGRIVPSYTFAGGYKVGAYASQVRFFDDADEVSLRSYGLLGGYETELLDVYAYAGKSEIDPDVPGIEIRDFGVNARYEVSPGFTLAGGAARTQVDSRGVDVDITALNLGAAYETGPWTVFGGYGRASTNDAFFGDDLVSTSVGLGGAYDLDGVAGVPLTVSLEYVRTSFEIFGDRDEADEVRVALSIPLGNDGGGAPAGTVASSAFNGGLTAFNSQIIGSF